ncbi:DUF559 domain-containing protein [Lysobacter niastensis]|uniref:DUF559 domain-containing protein n=1 Tax=Lysobacter niastensis TaxID=380629 RepID=UPI003D2F7D5A
MGSGEAVRTICTGPPCRRGEMPVAGLRRRNFEGFRFRRQVPLAGYVVDFLCLQARLVVQMGGHGQALGAGLPRTAILER